MGWATPADPRRIRLGGWRGGRRDAPRWRFGLVRVIGVVFILTRSASEGIRRCTLAGVLGRCGGPSLAFWVSVLRTRWCFGLVWLPPSGTNYQGSGRGHEAE